MLDNPQPSSSPSSGGQAAVAETPTGFPSRCDPAEVQVVLLGMYHFANPGLDAVKLRVDDVLAPARQREIADLVERLATWHPEQVAVEWLASDSASIAAQNSSEQATSLLARRTPAHEAHSRSEIESGSRPQRQNAS